MTKQLTITAAATLIGGLLAVLYFTPRSANNDTPQNVIRDTVTVVQWDTVYYTLPTAHDSLITLYKTVRVPVFYHDTIRDTVAVSLPVEQKYYDLPEADVWVSGIEPRLDSIHCYTPLTTTTLTVLPSNASKTSHWGAGVMGGVGITPEHGVQPFVGIGVFYKVWEF